MTPGDRIKILRASYLGLTLEQFGNALGVGKTAISKLEKTDRTPVSLYLYLSFFFNFNNVTIIITSKTIVIIDEIIVKISMLSPLSLLFLLTTNKKAFIIRLGGASLLTGFTIIDI